MDSNNLLIDLLKQAKQCQKALSPAKVKSASYKRKALPAEEVKEKRSRYIPSKHRI